eukprot:TRINITY_DN651_c0_g3_i2.p1 TRINITY_DN651_c0_g3~~TRINITY_DN651_c0_g3_i2.p1  ORF type:complete len:241 (+),score=60.11 TRINITY_DN651_c0_g3_i2:52-774(+)
MLQAVITALAVGVLPNLPGLPNLPSLPSGPAGGRPGPPNKGTVTWGSGSPIPNVEVDTKIEVGAAGETWTRVPEWLHWSTAHVVSFESNQGELMLTCPPDADNVPCTFYVVLYHCGSCGSYYGNLPDVLLSSGFSAGSCGPYYLKNGVANPTTTYKIELAAGSAVKKIPVGVEPMYAAIFELSIGQQCSNRGAPGCTVDDKCVLDAASNTCIEKPMCGKFHGPVPATGAKCVCLPMVGGR